MKSRQLQAAKLPKRSRPVPLSALGLSIVAQGLWKRWLGPRKPCEKVTEEAVKIRAKREAE